VRFCGDDGLDYNLLDLLQQSLRVESV